MGLASDLGLLFILEARDQASEAFERLDGVLGQFSETAAAAADTAKGAGDAIDESLASTASGADALVLADARVQAASEAAAAAISAQADAETALLATRDAAASQEELAAAAEEVTTAEQTAAAAAAELADAQKGLEEAQAAGDASADALAVAQERVTVAQQESAVAVTELTDAQQRQAALVTGDDVAEAANSLTAAEKSATAASNDLTAAQARQADVQKAVAASDTEAAEAAAAEADAQKQAAADAEAAQSLLSKATKTAGLISLGMVAAGYESVKAAGNFQSAAQHLVTDAGESQKNLQMVSAGILNVSTATGTAATEVENGMYHIESGGMHGAEGLSVLKVAAEGAKVGNADLDTVSKTLVGTLNSYYGSTMNASNATSRSTAMMNELITIVGSGDMKMQDLASSLGNVTPAAAKAGLSLAQVGGAIATMTSQNMSAQQASQDLANTIRTLENPSAQMTTEMAQMGLNSQTVASQLGKKGLTGTVQELTQAITSHMGSAGTVLMSSFNKSTVAAQDANTMLKQLPASIQSVAKGYMDGSVSYNTWYSDTKSLPLQARTMADQFATVAGNAKGFNNLLKAGGPAAQTYTAALRQMTGNATSLNTVEMLSGTSLGTFNKNVNAAAAAAKGGSGSVANWSKIQGTFNQKMDSAKTAVENTGIAIGTAILPAVTSLASAVLKVLEPIAEFTSEHRTLTEILFTGVTAIAATITVVGAANKAFKAVKGTITTLQSAYRGIMKMFGQAGAEQAAGAEKGAAAQEEAAAKTETSAESSAGAVEKSAAEQETASGEAAATMEMDAAEIAAANEEGAAESSSSWLASMASSLAGAVKWVAQGLVKVAVYVGENLAGAAASAAAWLAANAVMLIGIVLVVAAVAAAVYEIVTHWKSIEKFFETLWHDIVSVAKSAWNGLVSAVTGVWDRILAFVKSWWPLLLGVVTGPLGVLVGLVIKYHAQILAAIEDAWHAVLSFVEGLWDDIVSDAETVWSWVKTTIETVHDDIRSVIQTAWDWVREQVESALDDVRSVVNTVWGWIKDFINTEVNGVKNIIAWFGSLPGLFRGWWNDAVSAIESAWGKAESYIRGIPGRVMSGLSNLYNDMLSVGKNIVIGIWNGLASMGGWLMSQAEGFAHNVVSSIEGAFGIHSPSKLTTVHGQMLASGVAVGITQGTAQAVAAAQQMARKVLAATSSLSGSGLSAGASLASGYGSAAAGGGAVVVLNVTGNTVMSDSDIDKLTQKIGKRLATVTLPQAGRKVRLA